MNAKVGFEPVTMPVCGLGFLRRVELCGIFELETQCSFATVYHSLYATVAYPDMQRWHKVNDTPSHHVYDHQL